MATTQLILCVLNQPFISSKSLRCFVSFSESFANSHLKLTGKHSQICLTDRLFYLLHFISHLQNTRVNLNTNKIQTNQTTVLLTLKK